MVESENLVLVTGGTGYIALHVIGQLLKKGYRVRTTVRNSKKERSTKPILALEGANPETVEIVNLDLLGEQEDFEKAARGCSYVLHTASPFPSEAPKDEMELIRPAKEGTLKMLKACTNVGGVKRVIVTSSIAAVYENDWDESMQPMDESFWSKPEKCGAYTKSKLIAEQSAWEYHKSLPESSRFELATVNPGFVLGPMLSDAETTSSTFLRRFMNGEIPAIPNLFTNAVDVRDVAKLHILAMTSEKAAGERFIASEGFYNFRDFAIMTSQEMKQYGYHVATMPMPWALAKFASFFNKSVKLIMPMWGKKQKCTGAKAERVFEGFKYTPMKETVADHAHATVENNLLAPTKKYKAAFGNEPYSSKKQFL